MGPWKRSHSENSLNVIVSGQVAIDNNGVTTDNSAMDSALQRKKKVSGDWFYQKDVFLSMATMNNCYSNVLANPVTFQCHAACINTLHNILLIHIKILC